MFVYLDDRDLVCKGDGQNRVQTDDTRISTRKASVSRGKRLIIVGVCSSSCWLPNYLKVKRKAISIPMLLIWFIQKGTRRFVYDYSKSRVFHKRIVGPEYDHRTCTTRHLSSGFDPS